MTIKKPYSRSLFIFRRDLRLEDNTALERAARESAVVQTCFILDPRQCTSHPYLSLPGRQFLFESLKELARRLEAEGGRLALLYGQADEVLEKLLSAKDPHIDAVYSNRDYTPFARSRDAALEKICTLRGVPFHQEDDALLFSTSELSKPDGTPYKMALR